MVLWRISIFDDLSGIGAEVGTGRWHTPSEGKRLIYLAEHPALALIESLVNLRAKKDYLPESFQLLKVESPPDIAIESIAEGTLSKGWRDDFVETQSLGNDWLSRRLTALLAIPSAPSPESTNYLFNPLHPDAAGVKVAWSRWIRYDRRLFRLSE